MKYFKHGHVECIIGVLKTQIAIHGDIFDSKQYNGLTAKKLEDGSDLWHIEAILTPLEYDILMVSHNMDFEDFCTKHNIEIDYSECLMQ